MKHLFVVPCSSRQRYVCGQAREVFPLVQVHLPFSDFLPRAVGVGLVDDVCWISSDLLVLVPVYDLVACQLLPGEAVDDELTFLG
jgi:hypothetical protein